MGNLFAARPDVLKRTGTEMSDQAIEFGSLVKKIYDIKNQLLASGYASPASAAIGKEIDNCHEILDTMTKTIKEHGEYFSKTSSDVTRNENNIIDQIKTGTGGYYE